MEVPAAILEFSISKSRAVFRGGQLRHCGVDDADDEARETKRKKKKRGTIVEWKCCPRVKEWKGQGAADSAGQERRAKVVLEPTAWRNGTKGETRSASSRLCLPKCEDSAAVGALLPIKTALGSERSECENEGQL